MFQVQQTQNGRVVCDVGTPYATREEAEAAARASARADWERTRAVTPSTHFVVVEAPRPAAPQSMTLRRDDAGNLVPVQLPVVTVAQLAKYFAELAAQPNCANLPVYTSDERGCYPFEWMETRSPSGYRDAVLIKPRPDCHLRPVPRFEGDTSPRQVDLNAEADRVRAACGAFYF